MIFTPTPLAGVYLLGLAQKPDPRGFFARTWCARELAERGLETRVAQCSISYSARRGTLRGMHFQAPPHAEVKLVRCLRGALLDVVIDLRPESPTFCGHVAVELNQENRLAIYVPAGCAHGLQTLVDDTEISYQMSEFYDPELSRGVRWNDPAFGIPWPILPPILLPRDEAYPDFVPESG